MHQIYSFSHESRMVVFRNINYGIEIFWTVRKDYVCRLRLRWIALTYGEFYSQNQNFRIELGRFSSWPDVATRHIQCCNYLYHNFQDFTGPLQPWAVTPTTTHAPPLIPISVQRMEDCQAFLLPTQLLHWYHCYQGHSNLNTQHSFPLMLLIHWRNMLTAKKSVTSSLLHLKFWENLPPMNAILAILSHAPRRCRHRSLPRSIQVQGSNLFQV